jgi:O-antigen ligase
MMTVSALALAGAMCMVWSGSKTGWLLAMLLGIIAFFRVRLPKAWKWAIIGLVLVTGLVAFRVYYDKFFQRGATSVSARFDYWKAAGQTFADHPVFGSGPGTFYLEYMKRKAPESEVTRLCHNDYLEQGCDSGAAGFLTYGGWVVLLMVLGWNVLHRSKTLNPILFSVWLGLLGFFLHSAVDFHLYIPGLAWTAFFLGGWMCGRIRRGSTQASFPESI